MCVPTPPLVTLKCYHLCVRNKNDGYFFLLLKDLSEVTCLGQLLGDSLVCLKYFSWELGPYYKILALCQMTTAQSCP